MATYTSDGPLIQTLAQHRILLTRSQRLLQLSQTLQQAKTFVDIIGAVRREIAAATGYNHAWLFVLDDDLRTARMISVSSALGEAVEAHAHTLDITRDPFLQDVVTAGGPVVIEDARLDPRTDKKIVEALGNRTIINIPVAFLDRPLILLGTGTFGDEGVKPPTEAELEFLTGIAAVTVVAAARIRYEEQRDAAAEDRRRMEAQLLHARKLESLGVLAGGMAQDFNSLLATIFINADLAQMQLNSDDPVMEALSEIQVAASRAAELTGQILAYAGQAPIQCHEVELGAACEEMLRLIKVSAGEDIVLELDAGEALWVRGDPSQLRLVLLNILTNAIEAIGEGPGRVLVSLRSHRVRPDEPVTSWTERAPRPGQYVALKVHNDGLAIEAAALGRLFDPFFSTKAQGRGLGLASVQGIVRAHEGAISVQSHPEAGTTFEVFFPQIEPSAATPRATPQPFAPQAQPPHILLADDDEGLLSVLKRLLSSLGVRVTAVSSGDKALELLQASTFDLVVLDLAMSGRTGIGVLREARARQPTLPAILISGFTLEIVPQDLRDDPKIHFLGKPFPKADLEASLRALLDDVPA